MGRYIQFTPSEVIHTVMETPGELAGENVVEIPEYDDRYFGCKYKTEVFYGLEISAPKSEIATGEVLSIVLSWRDLDGQLVDDQTPTTITCAGVSEMVTAEGGEAVLPFESAEPGNYRIEAQCADGCRASLEVIVVENTD